MLWYAGRRRPHSLCVLASQESLGLEDVILAAKETRDTLVQCRGYNIEDTPLTIAGAASGLLDKEGHWGNFVNQTEFAVG